ncbi:MAG: hypothetical protein IJT30_02540 [Muribaculaceae bacterium]|nr:hypothetical protein [Muribaculaceae bacterium]
MIDPELQQHLSNDPNGLTTYEFMANNIGTLGEDIIWLVKNIINVDRTGQFVVSTARYLHAIDHDKYAECIDLLVKAAIVKDRERVYLRDLTASLWGPDYQDHAAELALASDNFRRIYKRLYPMGI